MQRSRKHPHIPGLRDTINEYSDRVIELTQMGRYSSIKTALGYMPDSERQLFLKKVITIDSKPIQLFQYLLNCCQKTESAESAELREYLSDQLKIRTRINDQYSFMGYSMKPVHLRSPISAKRIFPQALLDQLGGFNAIESLKDEVVGSLFKITWTISAPKQEQRALPSTTHSEKLTYVAQFTEQMTCPDANPEPIQAKLSTLLERFDMAINGHDLEAKASRFQP